MTETIEGGKAVVNVRPGTDVEDNLNKGLNDLNTNVKLLTQEMQHLTKNVESQVNIQSTIGKDLAALTTKVATLEAQMQASEKETSRKLQSYAILVGVIAFVAPIIFQHWK